MKVWKNTFFITIKVESLLWTSKIRADCSANKRVIFKLRKTIGAIFFYFYKGTLDKKGAKNWEALIRPIDLFKKYRLHQKNASLAKDANWKKQYLNKSVELNTVNRSMEILFSLKYKVNRTTVNKKFELKESSN